MVCSALTAASHVSDTDAAAAAMALVWARKAASAARAGVRSAGAAFTAAAAAVKVSAMVFRQARTPWAVATNLATASMTVCARASWSCS